MKLEDARMYNEVRLKMLGIAAHLYSETLNSGRAQLTPIQAVKIVSEMWNEICSYNFQPPKT